LRIPISDEIGAALSGHATEEGRAAQMLRRLVQHNAIRFFGPGAGVLLVENVYRDDL
jgi:hypothetical protein